MPPPITPANVRTFLEGYGISGTVFSDPRLQTIIDSETIPYFEKVFGFPLDGTLVTKTVYLSPTGSNVVILPHRFIKSAVTLKFTNGADYLTGISNFVLDAEAGLLIFNQNSPPIRGNKSMIAEYQVGFTTIPADVINALNAFTAERVLGYIANQTGGGGINTDGWSRDWGPRGKWTNIRNELARLVLMVVRRYHCASPGGV